MATAPKEPTENEGPEVPPKELRAPPKGLEIAGPKAAPKEPTTQNPSRGEPLTATPQPKVQAILIDRTLLKLDEWLGKLEDLHEQLWGRAEANEDVSDGVENLWKAACKGMSAYQEQLKKPRGQVSQTDLHEVGKRADCLAEFMRTMVVVWEEPELKCPPEIFEIVWTIRIAPLAYLRAMWNLFWSSIRHPLSETTIELKTGRVLTRT